ncbi:MAG: hypothetical protein AAF845_06415 [Bacteroidota bacterium]
MSPAWIVPLFLLAFPLFWSAVCWLIAQMGWSRLAASYRTEAPPTGRRLVVGIAYVGVSRYSGVLSAHVEPEGLRLSVLFLFRPGHPPVLLPWDAIVDIRPRKALWKTLYVLEIGDPKLTTVTVPETVVEAIAEAAPTPLPGRSGA